MSNFTPSLRLEKQIAGTNVNVWGDPQLNNVIQRADFSVAGVTSKALTANYTLTTSNSTDDEARAAILKFTGVGAFVVTIPPVSKKYDVYNLCTGTLTITMGAGPTVNVLPGEIVSLFCDGAGVYKVQSSDFGGLTVSSLGAPVANTDAATKKYVDDTAFNANAGILPGQVADSILYTNGTTPSWMLLDDLYGEMIALALAF